MAFDGTAAFSLFIAVALFTLAITLLLAGRRSPQGVLLAVFLSLVGTNFAASALGFLTADPRWSRVGMAALALDPVFLLAFVTLYPYPRRTPRTVQALSVFAVVALLGVALAVFVEDITTTRSPSRLLLVLVLGAVYTACWFLSIRAALTAPTTMLGHRAAWLVGAVGVAVVPRVGLLPDDFGFRESLSAEQVSVAVGLVLMAGLFFLGWRSGRRKPELRAPFLLVAVALGLVTVARLVPFVWIGVALVFTYGLRWIVFAAILMYGLLAHEVVEFRRTAEREIPLVGGFLGATAGLLFALALGNDASAALPWAMIAGLSFGTASWWTTRALARQSSVASGGGGLERRLTLYQAALEAAWAQGAPTAEARRQLEADRRAFGISFEEARALEHTVAANASAERPSLRPGDEPATGLVVERMLGEGAHGRVFLANRYSSGERVVVKELRPEAGVETRRRFLSEARALQALEHPNIVRLLQAQVVGGRCLLVMEYVEAQPLSAALVQGPLPPRRTKALGRDLLDALETAHARGFLHRDLKPSNVLLASEGRALITDFGLAAPPMASVEATVSNLDALGALQGTLAYMAPEQVRGGTASVSSDLYAVGLILHEALTARPALDLRGKTIYAAIEAVASPRVNLAATPPAWRPFLSKALHPDAVARYASAAAMRRDLLALP